MNTLVSIVIPARNEADNIGPLERELGESLAGLPYDFEFIVIDNARTARTAPALTATCARVPACEPRRVRRGFRAAGTQPRAHRASS